MEIYIHYGYVHCMLFWWCKEYFITVKLRLVESWYLLNAGSVCFCCRMGLSPSLQKRLYTVGMGYMHRVQKDCMKMQSGGSGKGRGFII